VTLARKLMAFDWLSQQAGCDNAVTERSCQEGQRLPVPVRYFGNQALPAREPPMGVGNVRFHPASSMKTGAFREFVLTDGAINRAGLVSTLKPGDIVDGRQSRRLRLPPRRLFPVAWKCFGKAGLSARRITL
jgi:hypothetical protein